MINTKHKALPPMFISHRGNLEGIDKNRENSPQQIMKALSMGLYVETDLWFRNDSFFLGHDEPQYKINDGFLLNEKIIWHCKNTEALKKIHNTKLHYFWHCDDEYTITSKGYIWCHMTAEPIKSSIIVLNDNNFDKAIHAGICSDNIIRYA